MCKTRISIIALCALLSFFAVLARAAFGYRKSNPPIPAQEFVGKFFVTPLDKMSDLDNRVYRATYGPEPRWTGSFAFDCETVPVLKDQDQYKPSGEVLDQIDSNVATFGKRAFPLLHSNDVECIRKMWNLQGDPPTYNVLIYSKKTKTYFFHHNDRCVSID